MVRARKVQVRVLIVCLVALCLGAGPVAPAGASGDDTLVVLYDVSGSVGSLLGAVDTAGWEVLDHVGALGLMRIERDGILALSTSALIGVLEALNIVRAVEEELDATLHQDVQGKTSQFVVFEDEMLMASIRPQEAFGLIGVPLTAPTPSATAPRLAVLDGGFEFQHEMLPASAVTDGYDAITGDDDPEDLGNGIDDDGDGIVDGGVGHGLGMAASALVICPHAELLCVRILDDEGKGTSFTLAAGLAWALGEGADVVNISAGLSGYSEVVDMLLADAENAGVTVVAAAGNDGAEVLDFPASSPHVLAITSVEDNGDASLFGNYETAAFLAAPGSSVAAPYPGTTDGYGWWWGTSMSSALVAGAAALVRGEYPTQPAQVTLQLVGDAGPFGVVPTEREDKLGAGILDVSAMSTP